MFGSAKCRRLGIITSFVLTCLKILVGSSQRIPIPVLFKTWTLCGQRSGKSLHI